MTWKLLAFVYRVLPFVPCVYAMIVYLVPRPPSRAVFWVGGVTLAGLLVVGSTIAMRVALGPDVPMASILATTVALFGIPMAAALLTVVLLRRFVRHRWLGALILIVACVVVERAARNFVRLDVVQATE